LIDEVEIPLGFRQLHIARLTNWDSSSFRQEFGEVLESVKQLLSRASETTFAQKPSTSEIPGEEQPTVRPSDLDALNKKEPKPQRWGFPAPRLFKVVAAIVIVSGLIAALYVRDTSMGKESHSLAQVTTR
jgi:hypothetical protein